jgi:hypothetical protein
MTNSASNLDPTAYSWKKSKDNAQHWRRRALGGESRWMVKPKEYREIFVSGNLILETPIPISKLTEAAQTAWLDLRYEVPEICVTTIIGEDGEIYMEYKEHNDEVEVRNWRERTAFVEYGTSVLSFQELRRKLMSSKQRNQTDSALFLVYITPAAKIGTLVRNCQLMLNVDHQITDGNGTRILFGKFLSMLAKSLSFQPRNLPDDIARRNNGRNLSTPWIEVMNDEQVISGSEYEQLVLSNEQNLSKLVIISSLQHIPIVLRS